MPRFARLVVPGFPHHVTQRGSRKQRTFFNEEDYAAYIDLLADQLPKAGVEVLAYCLMPNHVHLILTPREDDSLATLLRRTHSRYARLINAREDWQGHLWQERFFSCVMDEHHMLAAARYVELNPVRAGLCAAAEDWKWSSVHFHLGCCSDPLIRAKGMLQFMQDWQGFLLGPASSDDVEKVRECSRSGRPAGAKEFVDSLETITGRRLHKRRPGPKPS